MSSRRVDGRLDRRRLARVGGRDGARVAAQAGCALLVASAAWFVFVAFRPLPESAVDPGVSPSPTPLVQIERSPMEARQELLAAVESRGNLFSADGAAWPVAVASAEPAVEGEQVFSNADEPGDEAGDAPALPPTLTGLALSESPPSAIVRELQSLTLRGIYGVDGQLTALIYDGSNQDPATATGAYRVGDKVGKAPWDLLAIDPDENRVIVRRAGQVLEVRMYKPIAGRPVEDAAPAESSLRQANDAGVVAATADEISVDLQRAGVPLSEIAALLSLAESVEMPADAPVVITTAPPATAPTSAGDGATPTRAMPTEMVDLLRMMAGDTARRKANGEQPKEGEPAPTPAKPPETEPDH